MADWQFTEILVTLRDYQTLLNQISVVLITSSGVLAFKNRRLKGRRLTLGLSTLALILGIVNIVLGFHFRSKMIEIIPDLKLDQNPSSLTDPNLKCLTLLQIGSLVVGAIVLVIAAAKTPRERVTNGE